MDTRGDKETRSDDLISTGSTERVVRGLDGETYKVRGTDNTQDTRGNGVTGDSSQGEGTGESSPRYTRPDTLELFGWKSDEDKESPKRGRPPGSGKNIVNTKNAPGINAKTCGNIVGGIMDAISFLLTRTPILGLSEEEEKEMGESLYETIQNFPAQSTTVKLLNFAAPWAGVVHTGSKIVWKRMAFISAHRVKPPQPNAQNPPIDRGMVFAPDPSLVN